MVLNLLVMVRSPRVGRPSAGRLADESQSHMWCVCILREPESKRQYTGYTENLERRLAEHRTKKPKYKLAYKEEFGSQHEAMTREKFLKTGDGRRWLKRCLFNLRI